MQNKELADELVDFLSHYFHSVRQLEVFLWMFENSSQAWTAAEIAGALRANAFVTQKWLEDFSSRTLLLCEGNDGKHFRFNSGREGLNAVASRLSKEYKIRRGKVINVIVGQPSRKMMEFMDAFNLRRGEGEK